ncbi:dihydrolipoyl dehydrogenase family protein [Myxococcus sp. NMCA1]|uniref:dihydrolipoyl dehydrogenase family protein n=1 Tax=Myxococcus sp. NMCA1 TaxID=2996785 RepID=UPI00228626F1|nr:NAD(P)/FAD-dependent oxidoreductase [Myxococcus sp. NMCA1]WAM28174.1 NAD(P)/FAD-dependent oxidoreductase [Myxococcus sp. NMCA1]
MNGSENMDVVVIGAGPAGLLAALRAGDLGARTALVTRDALGGMAAHDGPVPVRTLAQAARLLRDARQLGRYGIAVSEPVLDYARLLTRVREVAGEVCARAALREQIAAAGVTVYEHAGAARFVDPHTVETQRRLLFRAEKFILCSGGVSRRLPVPGFDLTATHSDAWSLTTVPPTMVVVGGGATGAQVASVFTAFGTRVQLFQAAGRILPTEDEDVSTAVAESFRQAGMVVREDFGAIERFEEAPGGVRMVFARDNLRDSVEAALVVVAVGWTADTSALNLAAAGVETDSRGFVRVDAHLRTSVPHIFAAGDVTGRRMLVPQALQDGFVAGSNTARAPMITVADEVCPIGSFTNPEYAQAGLTEAKARQTHDVAVAVVRFDTTTRTIIDGRTTGFCKLVVDRATRKILGCHVVGERAVDLVQTAAIAIAAGMRVDELAHVPLSFPTYTGVLGRAAAIAARQLQVDVDRAPIAELLCRQDGAAGP